MTLSVWGLYSEHLPDEGLMQKMEEQRKWGRDDYPIRPVWNSVLAGIVYEHGSAESLWRELLRNGELRERCGFDPHKGSGAVPPLWVYTRFLKLLFKYKGEIDRMFDRLVDELKDYCRIWVGRGGGFERGQLGGTAGEEDPGGWAERHGCQLGEEDHRGKREDGTLWEKVVKWFGYKIHLLVDTHYEMPMGYWVTVASASDRPELSPLVEVLREKHPQVYKDVDQLIGDKGYDSEDNCQRLYDTHEIKPVIDIRRMWRDKETKLINPGVRITLFRMKEGPFIVFAL